MGLWRNVAFAHAPIASVREALASVFAAHGHVETAWDAPADLQHARAATTPWWAAGGFEGALGWTCVLTAPFDVLTGDGGAQLGELARALRDEEVWQLDVEGGDSMRVVRAVDGRIARTGYLSSELDAGMEFDGSMTLPILADVTLFDVCAAARARHPDAAELVERLARADVADVEAAAGAIAVVFGGASAKLVDNLTTIDCLIRRTRPLRVARSFALFTSSAVA